MKKYSVLLLLLAANVCAQDLGGVGQFVSNIAKSARGGTGLDLNLHTSGVLYVPYPTLHSQDGKVEYAVLGLGAELGNGVSGTRLHGAPLVLPLVNIVGVMDKVFSSNWCKTHLSFPAIGNVALGIGIKPLPVVGSGGKWVIGNQILAVITFGLGGA